MSQATRSVLIRGAIGVLIAGAFGSSAWAQRFSIVAPTTITTPGCYTVDSPINTSMGPPMTQVNPITIATSDVHLDLAGNSLTASPTGVRVGVMVGTGLRNVSIRNGKINGGFSGIQANGVDNIVVEDVQFAGASGAAIDLIDVRNAAIRRNEMLRSDHGVRMIVQVATTTTGTIEDNLMYEMGLSGVLIISGSNVAVLDNRIDITLLGLAPINVWDSSTFDVSRNTLSNSTQNGIDILRSFNGRVTANTVTGSTGHGISLTATSNTYLADNVVGGNTLTGIRINGSWNHLERNTLNGNGESNLWFDASGAPTLGNTYGRNSIMSGGALPSACGVPTPCGQPASICNDGSGTSSFGDNRVGTVQC